MVLWNSTELNQTERGFENTALSYSTDGGATFTAGENLLWTERTDAESGNLGNDPVLPTTTYAPEVQVLATPVPGVTHVRMVVDNFSAAGANNITMAQEIRFTGLPAPEAYYVAATPTDWADATAWSDGNPASAGTQYFATNSVVLETPGTTATFPGEFLTLGSPQRMELMVTGSDVITIDPLNLDGADLGAGVVDAGEAKIDGTIKVIATSRITGATNETRDVRILSEISSLGPRSLALSAPGHTIYIDNSNNTFDGLWVVEDGAVEFASAGAVGTARFNVSSNATLRILGNWDGLSTGESLTVADSPNASVVLGTNAWTVSSLMIGSSNILTGFTYDVSELNAFASNAVFSGTTGTIQVGDPYIPPPPPTTYYLQATMPANRWIGEQALWYDDPVAGNVMPYYAIFTGSTFDVNGFAWRAQNTGATATFDGLLVVQGAAEIIYLAYGADMQLNGGMIITNNTVSLSRPHRSTGSGTTVSDLYIDAGSRFDFRTLQAGGTDYLIQSFSVGNLSGDGEIRFGTSYPSDPSAIWSFSVTEQSTNFAGTVRLEKGQLTIDSNVILENASFVMPNNGTENSLILSNDMVLASFSYGGTALTSGTWTAAELNTEFSTDRFSGSGTVSFEYTRVYAVPVITGISVDAVNVTVSGTSSNVNAGAEYRLKSASNLTFPVWNPVATNMFDGNGDFSVSTPVDGTEAFYQLEVGP